MRVLQGRRDDVLLLSGGGEEGAASSSSRARDAWWKKERERYRQRTISDCAKRNATRGEGGGADGLEVTGCKGFLGSGGGGEVVVVMAAQEVLMPRGLKMVL